MWASQSFARSPATVGLISGSCSSARAFAPRFFQAPPRGECYFTLALRYDFTSIWLSKGLSPSSCRACSAHNKKWARSGAPITLQTESSAATITGRLHGIAGDVAGGSHTLHPQLEIVGIGS